MTDDEQITLYPGYIVCLERKMNEIIRLKKFVDRSGPGIELIARRRGGERCVVRIDTTDMESRKGILRVGRLACAPEDEADQT